MKIKDYFKNGFGYLVKAFVNLGKGLFFGAKRWFVEYPHFAYPLVIALLVAYHIFTIASARAERDDYNHKSVILQERLDSIMPRNIKYEK